MSFNFSKRRYYSGRYYNPRGLLRNSGRYWDYVLQPFWDEMNCGIAQDAVQRFETATGISSSFNSSSPILSGIATQTSTLTNPLPSSSSTFTAPSSSSVNVHWVETPTSHIYRADVPGLRKEELAILVDGTTLQISGKRNLERIPTDVNERILWEAPFVRRLRLPTNAEMDQIHARLEDGVLTLTIPKIPIPPSLAWFVPINGRCTPEVTVRTWSQQEQREPNSQSSFQRFGRSSIESRIQDINLPSALSTEGVFSRKRDTNLTSNSDCNSLTDPKSSSKTLNITQEERTGPNAQVTLNININTGKVSAEGESSSVKISPTNQMEDETSDQASPQLSSRSRSISPLVLKPRPSLAQVEDYQDDETNPTAPVLKHKSSLKQEDNQNEDLNIPRTSTRKSSIPPEDLQDVDVVDPPSTFKRKSSVQVEDPQDEVLEPIPSTKKHVSLLQAEDLEDEEDEGTSDAEGVAINERRRSTKRGSQVATNEGEGSPNDKERRRSSIRKGSQVGDRKASIAANDEGEGTSTSNLEGFANIERRRSSKRGSQVVERQPSIVANEESSAKNAMRRSTKRGSQVLGLRKSLGDTNDEGEGTSNSDAEGFANKERRRSTKRGSQVLGIRKSSGDTNDEGEGTSNSDVEGFANKERRRSTKRGSQVLGLRKSSGDTNDEGEGTSNSDVEGFANKERRRSTKRGSQVSELRKLSGATNDEGEGTSNSNVEGLANNDGRRSSKRDSLQVGERAAMVAAEDAGGLALNEKRRSSKRRSNSMERRESESGR